MQVKEETSIVQSNFLIENRPKLTKDETRLFLTIVGAVNKDDEDFKPLEIPVAEFADLWHMDLRTAYNRIKIALRGLVTKEFFVEGINPKTGKVRFLSASYVSTATYEEGQGYATVEISPLFKPYLLALKKNYTMYVLENILNLTTVNTIRNYELLKQYETLGSRTFNVEDYKKLLGIEGKYNLNADLRRFVLEPAVSEINRSADIHVSYEILGRGKKAKIRFAIKQKPEHVSDPETDLDPNQISIFDAAPEDHEFSGHALYASVLPAEFTPEQVEVLRALAVEQIPYDPAIGLDGMQLKVHDYLQKKHKLMLAQHPPVKSKFSWLRKAVEEDWN